MPYCPKCLAEYRAGVLSCTDCGIELLPGPAPAQEPASFSPETEVVRLCLISDPAEADIVKAALAEAGIQSMVREHGPITARLTRVADGATHDYAMIYVTANRLEEAQRVLAAIRSAPVEWPEGMEPDETASDDE